MNVIAALDPGKDKCGLAAVSNSGEIIARKVVASSDIEEFFSRFLSDFCPDLVVMGSGTCSKSIKKRISPIAGDVPIMMVDESHSTEIARRLYFKEHPPKGLMRLVPIGLQIPPVPYDDFAAVVLARKYIKECGILEK